MLDELLLRKKAAHVQRLCFASGVIARVGTEHDDRQSCKALLGAQLCDENGILLERDYARAWLPETLKPGASIDVPIEIVAPKTPGNYVLKFDLVSEGIDWFENNGSPTTLKPLVVR